jgi:hypothetical protein
MRIEPLKQQDMAPDGKDKIGQDIETRNLGKLARKNDATVIAPVLKTAPNFNRARIPLAEKPSDSNTRVKVNQESYADRMTPEFNKGVDNIKED